MDALLGHLHTPTPVTQVRFWYWLGFPCILEAIYSWCSNTGTNEAECLQEGTPNKATSGFHAFTVYAHESLGSSCWVLSFCFVSVWSPGWATGPCDLSLCNGSSSWPLAWSSCHPELNLQLTHCAACTECIPHHLIWHQWSAGLFMSQRTIWLFLYSKEYQHHFSCFPCLGTVLKLIYVPKIFHSMSFSADSIFETENFSYHTYYSW